MDPIPTGFSGTSWRRHSKATPPPFTPRSQTGVTEYRKVTKKTDGQSVLWNHLCDRATTNGFAKPAAGDCRSPIELLSHITTGKSQTPILQAFLCARNAKRPSETPYDALVDQSRMAALKLFRKSYDRCDASERIAVQALASKGVVTVNDLVALVKKNEKITKACVIS
jgi:hypothetical protein